MKKGTIHYGFGKEYLPKWGIKEALREIYQNFLDYGPYTEDIDKPATYIDGEDTTYIEIKNDWVPESLEFLRVGNSKKTNSESIGKHGEGLKMAFLILLREGFNCRISIAKFTIAPAFYQDDEIGECFCLNYNEHPLKSPYGFKIEFSCPTDLFNEFHENIIRPEDMIFDDHINGKIVNKEVGKIYSGGLFVCKVYGMQNAYDIRPSLLPLDRDRFVPRTFDVNWATSKIKQGYGKFTAKDLSFTDSMYVERIPEPVKKQIKPVMVGNSIEFTYKGALGKTEVISNDFVKTQLKSDSFFTAAIKKLKRVIAKQLGLYDMLLEFEAKHVNSQEARADFELILEKCGKQEKRPKRKPVEEDPLPF